MRASYRTTPRSGYYGGVQMSTVNRRDYKSISQTERERQMRDWTMGTTWAAIALGLSFGGMTAIGILMGWC